MLKQLTCLIYLMQANALSKKISPPARLEKKGKKMSFVTGTSAAGAAREETIRVRGDSNATDQIAGRILSQEGASSAPLSEREVQVGTFEDQELCIDRQDKLAPKFGGRSILPRCWRNSTVLINSSRI
jgi:hypothetical protein